jgi:hypothetical protein
MGDPSNIKMVCFLRRLFIGRASIITHAGHTLHQSPPGLSFPYLGVED